MTHADPAFTQADKDDLRPFLEAVARQGADAVPVLADRVEGLGHYRLAGLIRGLADGRLLNEAESCSKGNGTLGIRFKEVVRHYCQCVLTLFPWFSRTGSPQKCPFHACPHPLSHTVFQKDCPVESWCDAGHRWQMNIGPGGALFPERLLGGSFECPAVDFGQFFEAPDPCRRA